METAYALPGKRPVARTNRVNPALALKRCIDVFGSALALLFLAPLFFVVAVTIWALDPGPVLYSQERLGKGGKVFRCLKFRSMIMNADDALATVLRDPVARIEWEMLHKLKNDPRVTRFGRFLRFSSIDELPQFLNVLRGDMSLVGPRPIVRSEALRYGSFLRDYLRTQPGLTGLWQVSGRNDTTDLRRIACEAIYSRRSSLSLDLWIMARTVPALLSSNGCY